MNSTIVCNPRIVVLMRRRDSHVDVESDRRGYLESALERGRQHPAMPQGDELPFPERIS